MDIDKNNKYYLTQLEIYYWRFYSYITIIASYLL